MKRGREIELGLVVGEIGGCGNFVAIPWLKARERGKARNHFVPPPLPTFYRVVVVVYVPHLHGSHLAILNSASRIQLRSAALHALQVIQVASSEMACRVV